MKRKRNWWLGAAEGENSCGILALVLLTVNRIECYLLVAFEWLWKNVRIKPGCGIMLRLGTDWEQQRNRALKTEGSAPKIILAVHLCATRPGIRI